MKYTYNSIKDLIKKHWTASSFLSLEGGVDVIEALWNEMKEIELIRETTYGCYSLGLKIIIIL